MRFAFRFKYFKNDIAAFRREVYAFSSTRDGAVSFEDDVEIAVVGSNADGMGCVSYDSDDGMNSSAMVCASNAEIREA